MKSLIGMIDHYKKLIIDNIDSSDRYTYTFIPRGNIYIRLFTKHSFEILVSISQDFTSFKFPNSWFSLQSGYLLNEMSGVCYYTRKVGVPGCKYRLIGTNMKFVDGSYRDFPKLIKQYNISPSFKDFKNDIEIIFESELLKLV